MNFSIWAELLYNVFVYNPDFYGYILRPFNSHLQFELTEMEWKWSRIGVLSLIT